MVMSDSVLGRPGDNTHARREKETTSHYHIDARHHPATAGAHAQHLSQRWWRFSKIPPTPLHTHTLADFSSLLFRWNEDWYRLIPAFRLGDVAPGLPGFCWIRDHVSSTEFWIIFWLRVMAPSEMWGKESKSGVCQKNSIRGASYANLICPCAKCVLWLESVHF